MVGKKYSTPPEEINSTETIEEDCILVSEEELKVALEDLEKVEIENRDLKDNVNEADECIKKLREQVKKFKGIYKEVSEQLILANETLNDLKV